jgi:hypothetical protein
VDVLTPYAPAGAPRTGTLPDEPAWGLPQDGQNFAVALGTDAPAVTQNEYKKEYIIEK